MERLNSILMLIDSAIGSVQRLSMSLRPPALDDFGLNEAIELVLTDFEKRTNITCEFIATPHRTALDRGVSTEVFRIFQEALTKHCPPCRGAKGYDHPAAYGRWTHYGNQG